MNTTPIEFMAWDKLGKHGEIMIADYKKRIEGLEQQLKPKNCFQYEHHTAFDGYCKHPNTGTKHLCEYLSNVGCNYYEPIKDEE